MKSKKNREGFLDIALMLIVMVSVVISPGLIVLAVSQADSTEALTPDFRYPAEVERVIDGDTIVVDLNLGLGVILNDQYLRFYGIDAWEMKGVEREKGLLAKEFLAIILEHDQIIIEIRPEWGNHGRGKYGRWLVVVYVAGVNINELLVSQGHAEKISE